MSGETQARPTARTLSALASTLFTEGPPVVRAMQRWRPYICPFDEIVPFVPPGSTVLDVGCGGGLLLGLLQRLGRLGGGTGFDTSGLAIDVARKMAARLRPPNQSGGPDLEFLLRAVEDPWPDGVYDVVCLVDVIHHVPRPARESVFAQAAGKVRAGGRLLYKDMCRRPRWRALANRAHDLVLARQWVRHVDVAEVESWAARRDLSLVHAARINRLWYGHDLRVFRKGARDGASDGSVVATPA